VIETDDSRPSTQTSPLYISDPEELTPSLSADAKHVSALSLHLIHGVYCSRHLLSNLYVHFAFPPFDLGM